MILRRTREKKGQKKTAQNGWKLGDLLKHHAEEKKRREEKASHDTKSPQKKSKDIE